MKIKSFNQYQIDFIVQEEKGIVVAKFKEVPIIYTTPEPFKKIDKDNLFFDRYIKFFEELRSLRGVARCSEEDKFNLSIGKRIAKTKLRKKYLKAVQKCSRDIIEKCYKINDNLFSLVLNCGEDFIDCNSELLEYGPRQEC